jgi:cell division protein FtsB
LNLYHEYCLRGFVFLEASEQALSFFGAELALRLETTVSMRKRNYIKTDRSSRRARWKKVLIAAGVLLILYFLVTRILGDMGAVKYYRMRAHYITVQEDIARLRQDNVRLRKDVQLLRKDAAYLERLARDRLGFARPGEIVYYYRE